MLNLEDRRLDHGVAVQVNQYTSVVIPVEHVKGMLSTTARTTHEIPMDLAIPCSWIHSIAFQVSESGTFSSRSSETPS